MEIFKTTINKNYYIKEAKKAIDNLKKNIDKAKIINDSFSKKMETIGFVNDLLVSEEMPTVLAEGWYTYLLMSDRYFNNFLAIGKKGSVLDLHKHEKEDEIIIVTEGKIKRIGSIENCFDNEVRIINDKSKPLFIPAGEMHGFEVLEDSKMIITFRPPIKTIREYEQ